MEIVRVDRVWKRYRRQQLGARSVREELARAVRRLAGRPAPPEAPASDFFALQDVSFALEAGESVGFIGRNGSGKSTILKLLAKITHPTRGAVHLRGSVASLIEVGAGFHPELSGRENIDLYGSIMGMTRDEVREKFDEIVEFAELSAFIDAPVKHYSSGMYVRLGFAVAAHVEPDILLIDEVLAVGDAAFRDKCQQRIDTLRRRGTTIVLVSHDMPAVEGLCNRAFLLDQGRIRSEGEPSRVIADYYTDVLFPRIALESAPDPEASRSTRVSTHPAAIVHVRFLNGDGQETDTVATGARLVVQLDYAAREMIQDPVFEVSVHSIDGRLQCQYTSPPARADLPPLGGRGVVEMVCDELGLVPGIFKVRARLAHRGALGAGADGPARHVLKVIPGRTPVRGLFYSPHRWQVVAGSQSRRTTGRFPETSGPGMNAESSAGA
jgi:ABC-type polysaccharide/polyol phosphate transport system ATPase subunit